MAPWLCQLLTLVLVYASSFFLPLCHGASLGIQSNHKHKKSSSAPSPFPSPVPSIPPRPTAETNEQDERNIFQEIRLRSEKKCLIPYKSHDPRTTLSHNNISNCVLFYLHFHKSGGTTICSMITQEGYKGNLKDNCLSSFSYRHQEYQFALDYHLNFVALEREIFEPNLTSSSIIYMTTIRHPYDRIISHLHHEICERSEADSIQFMKSQHCDGIDITTASLAEIILNPCFNSTLSYLSSNFYLKILTGCSESHRPCTEDDLKLAIDRLKIMSVIMITDTPEDYQKYLSLLSRSFS
jgi:hypothetical protein